MEKTLILAKQRRERADAITKRRTLYAAGAGLIPFPIIDVATLLVVQVNMIKDIARVYGKEEHFRKKQVQTFITTLVGDLGTLGVVSGVKAIPVVGSIVGVATAPITGAAATYALGKVFTNHFDQGGNLLDFDPVTSRKYFYEEFKAGQELVQQEQSSVPPTPVPTAVAAGTVVNENPAPKNLSKAELISESKRLLSALVILQQKIESHSQTTTSAVAAVTTAAATSAVPSEEAATNSAETSAAEASTSANPAAEETEEATTDTTSTTKKKKTKKKRTAKGKSKGLTLIEGIGPGIEKVLNNEGIYSLEDLAACEVSQLEDILKRAGGKFNFATPTTWPEQAQLAAEGRMEELKALQKELDGGKRKKS
ncbi:MAG: DUF697 domain-containing protein [Bacteroidota bacterium]